LNFFFSLFAPQSQNGCEVSVEDICVAIRRSPTWTDEEKEELIREGKNMKGKVKGIVFQILVNKGIKVV